jgi:hypothetical protein
VARSNKTDARDLGGNCVQVWNTRLSEPFMIIWRLWACSATISVSGRSG